MQGFLLLLICSYASDSAGCDCGFMSLERIRILLGLETVGDRIFSPHRQQITPDIKFTCDGLITKWILGADWHNDGTLYPELQVWRKSRNDIYHKKNGTVINVLSQSPTNIYKYDAFSPIPFLAGDILGIFLPQMANSKLRLWSERGNGPIVYHVDTGSSVESPVDAIDLKRISLLSTTSYLPLVTVEIGMFMFPCSLCTVAITACSHYIPTVVSSPTRSGSSLPTLIPTEPVATPPGAASINQTVGTDGDTIYNESLIVGMGVAGSLLVLITAAVIVIVIVLVCLRKNKKVNFTANVAYQSSTSEVKLSPNAAYTATGDHSPNSDELEYYLYIEGSTADDNANGLQTAPNPTYKITTSTNKAYGMPT